MAFRIAVVQPIAHPPGEDEKNVADAKDYIARAAAEGAQFVCFPETYPGPWRSAELIFMPAGKDKRALSATWRTLILARAIENLALVVTTQNLFHDGERGLAMIAAPEEVLLESTVARMSIVDVSLDRLRSMRSARDEVSSSAQFGAKQGVLGPQWQLPELYDTIFPRPPHETAE